MKKLVIYIVIWLLKQRLKKNKCNSKIYLVLIWKLFLNLMLLQ